MKKHYYTKDILTTCEEKHLTVDEIYEVLIKKFPNAGKSSIYRNVEELAQKGDLVKITGIGQKAYFEKYKEVHGHFICQKTGKIFDIPLSEILIPLPSGYHIKKMDIRLYGEVIS